MAQATPPHLELYMRLFPTDAKLEDIQEQKFQAKIAEALEYEKKKD